MTRYNYYAETKCNEADDSDYEIEDEQFEDEIEDEIEDEQFEDEVDLEKIKTSKINPKIEIKTFQKIETPSDFRPNTPFFKPRSNSLSSLPSNFIPKLYPKPIPFNYDINTNSNKKMQSLMRPKKEIKGEEEIEIKEEIKEEIKYTYKKCGDIITTKSVWSKIIPIISPLISPRKNSEENSGYNSEDENSFFATSNKFGKLKHSSFEDLTEKLTEKLSILNDKDDDEKDCLKVITYTSSSRSNSKTGSIENLHEITTVKTTSPRKGKKVEEKEEIRETRKKLGELYIPKENEIKSLVETIEKLEIKNNNIENNIENNVESKIVENVEIKPRYDNKKSKMCKHVVLNGSCSRPSDKCHFAHTVDELNIITCKFDTKCRLKISKTNPCKFIHSDETKAQYYSRAGKNL